MRPIIKILSAIACAWLAIAALATEAPVYTVTYHDLWGELNLYYEGKTIGINDYIGLKIEMADGYEQNSWLLKAYGTNGQEQYADVGGKLSTITFDAAKLGGGVKRVTFQTKRSGTHVARLHPALLIKRDGTEVECEPSVFWGCDITDIQLGVIDPDGLLMINELMQSNVDCVMDDLNEFPDSWVELYNPGDMDVDLKDFQLGVVADASKAWRMPSQRIEAKGRVLVYCDKEGNKLHTDFHLESGKGCEVFLFKNGQVVDQVTGLGKQPSPNIAYGREKDGAPVWGYQQTATPGAANCGMLTNKVLGAPVFSVKGQVITGNRTLQLVLSKPEGTPANAVIRYTRDGTEPTAKSPVYTTPISIRSNTVIRATLYADGWLTPRSTAHSYLFFNRQLTLPVVSIVTDNRYLNDNAIGIYVDGNYQNGKKNYEFNWRRPINFEYFEQANQESIINQLGETRVMGGASRGSQMKSIIIYANKRFGTKRLTHEFFPDQKPGLTDFKSIVLRNAGNDFDYLFMRDAIIQRTMARHADLDWQAWRPVIVYFNGVYKGMLNIRERSNADYVYTNYDGLEDIDMVENLRELKEGDWTNYNAFKAFYNESGHTLAEYAKWMDWEEYINLMAMNLYYNNQDFPGNNIVAWRPRTEDGRWRWIAKDTDFGIGLYGSSPSYKTLEWLHNPNYDSGRNWGANSQEATLLFRQLMADADFRREFIDHMAVYMGDFLNEKGTRAVWDPMYATIKTEYPYHRKLINQWWPNYDQELGTARNWMALRTREFYNQLGNFYKLGSPATLTINKEINGAGMKVAFNNITLTSDVFNGMFYANRDIHLSGMAPAGKMVKGWTVKQTNSNGTTSTWQMQGEDITLAMPSCRALAINAIIVDGAAGVGDITTKQWNWHKTPTSVVISDVAPGTKVTLFDLRGMALQEVVADGSDVALPINPHNAYIIKIGSETLKIASSHQ